MADASRARSLLTALAGEGVRLSIDDVGTGLSAPSYLKQPVSTLKIDKTFITAMLEDPHDLVIVRGVADLANDLGLTTVAEGVEDLPTLLRLGQMGCTQVPGYWTGRPMPAASVVGWARGQLAALDRRSA